MQKTFHFIAGLSLIALFLFSSCAAKVTSRIRGMDEIKKNGIVFRLHDYKQRYAHLEKIGYSELAAQERTENERYNRELMGYFRQHFNFCEVRFFYASQINDLKARRPVLLNADLQPDATLPLPERIIIAGCDYGNVDTQTYLMQYFRLEGSSIKIRHATFGKWLTGGAMDEKSVIRANRIMHKKAGDEK